MQNLTRENFNYYKRAKVKFPMIDLLMNIFSKLATPLRQRAIIIQHWKTAILTTKLIPTLNNSGQNLAAAAWLTIQATMYLLTQSSLGKKSKQIYSCNYMSNFFLINFSEVWFEFRQKIMSWAKLDPNHYLGLPSSSYDIFLYLSKKKINLIDDIQMIHFSSNLSGGY